MDSELRTFAQELYTDLPRQAPGGRDHTLRALGLVPDLPGKPRILDLGCGAGGQTIDLLEATDGTVVAVDSFDAFLRELEARAETLGVRERVQTVEADMASLPSSVYPAWFHMVWSEGAAYNMGFDEALRAWRHMLLPGGFIGISELSWLRPLEEVDEPARAYFSEIYPEMREHTSNLSAFEAAGYESTGCFTLPSSAWWDPYYAPLLELLPGFRERHPDNPAAEGFADQIEKEIDLYENYGDSYGYVFYIGRMR